MTEVCRVHVDLPYFAQHTPFRKGMQSISSSSSPYGGNAKKRSKKNPIKANLSWDLLNAHQASFAILRKNTVQVSIQACRQACARAVTVACTLWPAAALLLAVETIRTGLGLRPSYWTFVIIPGPRFNSIIFFSLFFGSLFGPFSVPFLTLLNYPPVDCII